MSGLAQTNHTEKKDFLVRSSSLKDVRTFCREVFEKLHIEQNLKESKIISLSRYCTIQRWKHGKRGDYVMLSMVWDVNVEEDIGLVVCKPIDGFITV